LQYSITHLYIVGSAAMTSCVAIYCGTFVGSTSEATDEEY
jgi:hypothetical protein